MIFPSNFISAGREFATLENFVPAPLIRRSFIVDVPPEKAELIITALGFYKLFINGEDITKGFLAPYRSNFDHLVYYDRYDVTDKLKNGKNTIGIILGNGLKNSNADHWFFNKARFRSAPATAFSVELNYGDENKVFINSDTEALTSPSPIIFDDLHYGEYYDATKEIKNWCFPEFDDSCWKNVISAEKPYGEARLCRAEPIIIRNSIEPIEIIKYDEGYIYDFGLNSSGLCKLKISGKRGQEVNLCYFETIVDGKPYTRNIKFRDNEAFQEDKYILGGDGLEEYTPSFTYHGFRYVYITGITKEQATKELLTYLEISSDIKLRGEFSCSDEIVNKIQSATVQSDFSSFHYFPTDCPQREKNGWTADASLSAEQMLINLTPENSYKEWMRNIYKAINDEGKLPGIVPSVGWGYEKLNGPAWDNVIVNLPYYTYIYRGDKEILKEVSIPLMRYLNYLFLRLDSNGLMEMGLGDWCQVGRPESKFDTPLVVTDTILTNDIANKAAFIYDVLGQEPQKQFALALAEKTRKSFRDYLIDYNTLEIAGKTQTAQSMAIYYEMLDENEKEKALNKLIEYIEKDDGHFNTGVLGGRVIYRVLAENGYADLAYNMITRPDYPSYGNWIKRGATTLWEAFMPEDGRILSLNHHFWGDVSAWFYTYLAGIKVNPNKNDADNINISPCFIENLTHINANYSAPNGEILVEWIKNKDKITLEINILGKINGYIILPKGYVFTDGSIKKTLQSGKYYININDKSDI